MFGFGVGVGSGSSLDEQAVEIEIIVPINVKNKSFTVLESFLRRFLSKGVSVGEWIVSFFPLLGVVLEGETSPASIPTSLNTSRSWQLSMLRRLRWRWQLETPSTSYET